MGKGPIAADSGSDLVTAEPGIRIRGGAARPSSAPEAAGILHSCA